MRTLASLLILCSILGLSARAENWVRVFHDEGGYVGTMSLSLDADRIVTQKDYIEFPVRQTMLGETEDISVRAKCASGEFQQVSAKGLKLTEWESPYDTGYKQLVDYVCKPAAEKTAEQVSN